jgi:hypothetical protein
MLRERPFLLNLKQTMCWNIRTSQYRRNEDYKDMLREKDHLFLLLEVNHQLILRNTMILLWKKGKQTSDYLKFCLLSI